MTGPDQSELAEWIALVGRLIHDYIAAPENWRPLLRDPEALPIVRLPALPDTKRQDLKLHAFHAAARIALREYLRSGDHDVLEMADADTFFELTLQPAQGGSLTVDVRMNSSDPRARLVLGVALHATEAAHAVAVKRFGPGSVTLRGLREVTNRAKERALKQALTAGASLQEAYELTSISPAAGKRIRARTKRSSLK